MDCTLYFYNAIAAKKSGKPLTAIQMLILARSNPLVHTEFQFSKRYDEISFSATMQDGDSGCRKKYIDFEEHPERWPRLILPMTDEQEDRGWKRSCEINGMPYDFIGVGSLASDFHIIKPDPNKFWCSEADAEVVKAAYEYGTDFQPDLFNPINLYFEMEYRIRKEKIA